MAILISPMIVPLIISATGMFFFYSQMGLWMEDTFGISKSLSGYIKVILAHAALGIPFVIITVTATLVGFDNSLTRAAANMGATPTVTFFQCANAADFAWRDLWRHCSPSSPRLTKSSWCSLSVRPRRKPCLGRCSQACASRSARQSWPWPRSLSVSRSCCLRRSKSCAAGQSVCVVCRQPRAVTRANPMP